RPYTRQERTPLPPASQSLSAVAGCIGAGRRIVERQDGRGKSSSELLPSRAQRSACRASDGGASMSADEAVEALLGRGAPAFPVLAPGDDRVRGGTHDCPNGELLVRLHCRFAGTTIRLTPHHSHLGS